MKYLAIFARLVFGLVFVFSGFVKSIDPLGSTYKIQDYMVAFGVPFSEHVSLVFAFVLCFSEFILGFSFLLGLRMKFMSWVGLLFISGFTLLTFVIALTNPVSDCGCFGDAIILTNWQTFYKNILLLALGLMVFLYRKNFKSVYSPIGEAGWIFLIGMVVALISFYCYRHLPLIDFRPYSVGTHIPSKMIIPEGVEAYKFNVTLYYEKDGVIKEFTEDTYPWNDTTWVYKNRKVEQITMYEPPIHDFGMVRLADKQDITSEVLADSGYTFLMISPRLGKASDEALISANDWALLCNKTGIRFLCLTSSSPSEIDSISKSLGLKYDFGLTDEITLKSIIRSNPGLIMLKEGIIYAKWAARDFPDPEQIMENPSAYVLSDTTHRLEKMAIYLSSFLFLSLLYIFIQFQKRGKRLSRWAKRRTKY